MTGYGGSDHDDLGPGPGTEDDVDVAWDRFRSLEEELGHSRDALRLALHAGRMGTWSYDADTDKIVWDDVLCELYGVISSPPDFAAWLQLVHPDDRARARETAERGMAEGKGYELVHKVVHPDGTVHYLDGRADVILDAGGRITGLRGVAIDVTDREEARLRAEALAASSRLLADAGGVLADTLDPDLVLRRLGEIVVPALADGCEVDVLVGDREVQRMVHAEGVDHDRLQRREKTPVAINEDHPIAQVLRTGQAVRLDASAGAEAFGPADVDTSASSFGITEAVIVPMTVRGHVLGALALGVGPSGRHLDEATIETATDLAARAALSFENARRFCEQRDIAETLQRSLLPAALPKLEWVELAARYWVPGAAVEVGGDFYDAVEGPAGVDLVIGDVCGKGVEAATLTGLARHTIRAALMHDRAPVEALRWLHEAFRAQAPRSFVTAMIARLLRYPSGSVWGEAVIAGHPRPVILRANGRCEVIQEGGTAPGLPVQRDAPVVPFTLYPGDGLVLYTDGVTDVPGDGALTVEQFCELIVGAVAGTAEDLATAIGDGLERVRSRHDRTDDIALLVTKVPPL